MALGIVSGIVGIILAIAVGVTHGGAGWVLLTWLLCTIGGIVGFLIGKFLRDWVGEYSFFTSGGFLGLVLGKFNALYGPMIIGFIIGQVVPLWFVGTRIEKHNKETRETALTDSDGISKSAKKYVLPLIQQDEKNYSELYGGLGERKEETKNGKIYVQWELLRGVKNLNELNSRIVPEFLALAKDSNNGSEITTLLNVDLKSFIPMRKYASFKYEDYDKSVEEYEKTVYNEIVDYIEKGRKRHYTPYNPDVAAWYKYFDYNQERSGSLTLQEKADYTHWYFDNGKQGTESDYENYKNKYSAYRNIFYGIIVEEPEMIEYLESHDGLFPGQENKVTEDDIEYFDRATDEKDYDIDFRDMKGKLDGVNLYTKYLKSAIDSYNTDFNAFVTDNWQDYPDTMKLHLEFEKQSDITDFSEYLKQKKLDYSNTHEQYYDVERPNYLYKNVEELVYNQQQQRSINQPIFNESVEAFEKDNALTKYFQKAKDSMLNDYYNSDEYKDRLSLYKQLVNIENAKLFIRSVYYIQTDVQNKLEAMRLSNRPEEILQIEVNTTDGWQKKEITIHLTDDGTITF